MARRSRTISAGRYGTAILYEPRGVEHRLDSALEDDIMLTVAKAS
jgi:hypothetical protein